MTLNGVMAAILRIRANSAVFGVHCIKEDEDIPKISATEM